MSILLPTAAGQPARCFQEAFKHIVQAEGLAQRKPPVTVWCGGSLPAMANKSYAVVRVSASIPAPA